MSITSGDFDTNPERDKVKKPTPLACCKMNPITNFFKSPPTKPAGIEGYFLKVAKSSLKCDKLTQSRDAPTGICSTEAEDSENKIQPEFTSVKKKLKKTAPVKSTKVEDALNESLEDFSVDNSEKKVQKKLKKHKQTVSKQKKPTSTCVSLTNGGHDSTESDGKMNTGVSEETDVQVVSYEDFLNSTTEDEPMDVSSAEVDASAGEREAGEDAAQTVVEMTYTSYLDSIACTDNDSTASQTKEELPTVAENMHPCKLPSKISTSPDQETSGKVQCDSGDDDSVKLSKTNKIAPPDEQRSSNDTLFKEKANKKSSGTSVPNIFSLARSRKNVKPVAALPSLEKPSDTDCENQQSTVHVVSEEVILTNKQTGSVSQSAEQKHNEVTSEETNMDDESSEQTSEVISPQKSKASSITNFFSRAEKKPEGKPHKKLSETLTVAVDVHVNMPSPSREQPAPVSVDKEKQQAKRKSRSNVAVSDMDMSITHLESTVIEIPDSKLCRSHDVKECDAEETAPGESVSDKQVMENHQAAAPPAEDEVILLEDSDVESQDENTSEKSHAVTAGHEPKKAFPIFGENVPSPVCSEKAKIIDSPAGKKKQPKSHSSKAVEKKGDPTSQQPTEAMLDKVQKERKNAKKESSLDEEAKKANKIQLAEQISQLDSIKIPDGKKHAQAKLSFSGKLNVTQSSSNQKAKKSVEKLKLGASNQKSNAASKSKKATGQAATEESASGTKQNKSLNSKTKVPARKRNKSADISDFESPQRGCALRQRDNVGQHSDTDSQQIDITPKRPRTRRLRYSSTLTPERLGLKLKLTKVGDSSGTQTAGEEDAAANKPKLKSKIANHKAQQLLQRAKDTKVQKSKATKAEPKPASRAKKHRISPSIPAGGQTRKRKLNQSSSEDEGLGLRRSSRHTAQRAKLAISEVYVVDDAATQKCKKPHASDEKAKVNTDEAPKKTPQKSRKNSSSAKSENQISKDSPSKTKKKGVKLASIFMKKGSQVKEEDDDDQVKIIGVSLDPEAERIRKAFLMSGVPETLKRQTCQVAAFSAGDYPSLPVVSHVQQVPDASMESCPDCWRLPSVTAQLYRYQATPSTSLIKAIPVSIGCLVNYQRSPTRVTSLYENFKGHAVISEEAIRSLLAEISVFNPSYPVRKVYRQLLRKKHLAENKLEPDKDTLPAETEVGEETKRKSRKRKLDLGNDEKQEVTPLRRSKRRRASIDCEVVIIGTSPDPKPATAGENDSVEDTVQKTVCDKPEVYCMQWPEKYRPMDHQEMFGSTSTVKRLHSWLEEWKQRTNSEVRKMKRQLLKQAQLDNTSKEDIKKECDWWSDDDSDFDLGSSDDDDDSDCDDAEDGLCNTQFLCGPHGVGKTALVYALATQLGYKVFEVNASSRRAGKQILSQLQEATQSHQVGKSNLDSMFTTFMATAEKSKEDKAGPQKKKLPTAFTNLFSKGGKASEASSKKNKDSQKQPKEKSKKKTKDVTDFFGGKGKAAPSVDIKKSGLNLSSTSLILFEEVDVIFEDDKGFWAAIQTFMSTTKRPIILTSSDPNAIQHLDCRHEMLTMSKSSLLVNTTTYLQLICLAENVRTDAHEIAALVDLCDGDLRRASLNLQFWVESGGGNRVTDKPAKYLAKSFTKRETASAVGPSVYVETALDSAEEFDLPTRRKRRHFVPVIEDDSSCSGFSPVKSRLLHHSEDSSQAVPDTPEKSAINVCQDSTQTCLAAAPNPADLVTSSVAVPPVHHTSLQCMIGHQLPGNVMSVEELRALGKDHHHQRWACVASFLSMNYNIISNNLCHLLHLPIVESQPVAFPLLKPKQVKPAKRRRIRSDLFDSEESDEEDIQVEEAQPEHVDKEESAAPRKTWGDSDRIVHSALSTLSDFFEDMSFSDSFLLQSHFHQEGPCNSDKYCDWSSGAVTSGMSSHVSHVDEPNWWMQDCINEIAAGVHVDTLDRTNASLKSIESRVEALTSDEKQCTQHQLSIPVPKIALDREYVKVSSSVPQQSQAISNKKAIKLVTSCMPSHLHLARQSIPKDVMPYIRQICRSEQMRKITNTKRRFMHYLDSISLSSIARKQTAIDNLCTSFF